jgi:hypothetical protein
MITDEETLKSLRNVTTQDLLFMHDENKSQNEFDEETITELKQDIDNRLNLNRLIETVVNERREQS